MMLQKNNAKKKLYLSFLSALLLLSVSTTAVWAQSAKSTDKQSEEVFSYVEQMPMPSVDINEYLSENLHYPVSARDRNIQGKVLLQFIIDKEGNVVDPAVISSPDTSLSKAALAALKHMPKWIPGKQHGKNVSVKYNLPVGFKLQ